jgi:hypothetical protein
MPKFILLLNGPAKYPTMTSEERQAATEQFMSWARQMRESGKMVGGERLAPAGRIIGPKPELLVTEAPFAETRETVGGFFIVEAEGLDQASEIARTNPHLGFGGSVEVRPIDDMTGN